MSARVLLPILLLWSGGTTALPDFGTRFEIDGIVIFRDREAPRTFYFLPSELRIAQQDDGGPHLRYTMSSYSGSTVHGDAGTVEFRVTFYARLTRTDHDAAQFRSAIAELESRFGRDVVLRQTPVTRMDATIVYAPIDSETVSTGEGFFEPVRESGSAAVWNERDVFLNLDTNTAQVIEQVLRNRSIGLTLSYSFFTEGWVASESKGELTAAGDRGEFASAMDEIDDTMQPEPSEILIVSDAIPIIVEEEFHESRFQRYHLDGTAPPDYASIVVYCFDFRNDQRDDLFEKVVEFEATGVAGGTTRHTAIFSSAEPELYGRTIRFPFAVDLREPFRWRAEEILNTGEVVESGWRTETSWAETIDVSGAIAEWASDDTGEEL